MFMAETGRPKAKLELTGDERAELERLALRVRTNRHLALRAKIILKCSEGLSNLAVASKVRVSNVTVGKWRWRFVEGRVACLIPAKAADRNYVINLGAAEVDSSIHRGTHVYGDPGGPFLPW